MRGKKDPWLSVGAGKGQRAERGAGPLSTLTQEDKKERPRAWWAHVVTQGPGFSTTNPALPPAPAIPLYPSSQPKPPVTQSRVTGPPLLGPHRRPGLRLLGRAGSAQEEAEGGGSDLGTHQAASCSTARCRPCPCAAHSPGTLGSPSGCSSSVGPAARLAPGRSAAANGSGRSRVLRASGHREDRRGCPAGHPEGPQGAPQRGPLRPCQDVPEGQHRELLLRRVPCSRPRSPQGRPRVF